MAIGVAASAGLVYALTHFAMTSDTQDLLSSKLQYRQRAAAFDALFQPGRPALVVIDGRTAELAESAAENLAARLRARPDRIRDVERPDSGFFVREGLLYQPLPRVQSQMRQLVAAQSFLLADPLLARTDDDLIDSDVGRDIWPSKTFGPRSAHSRHGGNHGQCARRPASLLFLEFADLGRTPEPRFTTPPDPGDSRPRLQRPGVGIAVHGLRPPEHESATVGCAARSQGAPHRTNSASGRAVRLHCARGRLDCGHGLVGHPGHVVDGRATATPDRIDPADHVHRPCRGIRNRTAGLPSIQCDFRGLHPAVRWPWDRLRHSVYGAFSLRTPARSQHAGRSGRRRRRHGALADPRRQRHRGGISRLCADGLSGRVAVGRDRRSRHACGGGPEPDLPAGPDHASWISPSTEVVGQEMFLERLDGFILSHRR